MWQLKNIHRQHCSPINPMNSLSFAVHWKLDGVSDFKYVAESAGVYCSPIFDMQRFCTFLE